MPEGNNRALPEQPEGLPSARATREMPPQTPPLLMPLQHFYRTTSVPCPYLPRQFERKLITELHGRDAAPLYDDLCRAGFRRSHHLAYRPSCAGCFSCVPVRVAAREFEEGRSTRRIRRINGDLSGAIIEPRGTVEQYRLFARYEQARHGESEMATMGYRDYCGMVEDSPIRTQLLALRDADRILRGICLIDRLDDGYSAVYSFFDPELARRSLGTFIVMWLIDQAKAEGLPYIYLGYWIAASDKMSYKTRFRPLEALREGIWQRLES